MRSPLTSPHLYVGADRCRRLLASCLRARQQARVVQALMAADGSKMREDCAIAEAFRDFYQEFHAAQCLPPEDPACYLQEA
ncbi:hypothetical protein NDU88_009862 [Pleurodeles waltl]|uniref:Uncharacterized protein n=1 Tax=Pleurodeles waltl TaxID=8319 RepID=A0AAV7RZL0_PLEWA|nr:hypothetical protein NDU88_009862 [Pleurodeles waltl]